MLSEGSNDSNGAQPYFVRVRFQASGTVDEYDAPAKAAILRVIVEVAGLPESTEGEVRVQSASVIIEVTLYMDDYAQGEAAFASLS